MYKIKGKKGWVLWTITLYRKWFFLWIPVMTYRTEIGNGYGLQKEIEKWMTNFDVPEEKVYLKRH